MNPDEPSFITEPRGGFDEMSTERDVIIAVATSDADLQHDDDVLIDTEAAPFEVEVDADELVATIEMGSWVGNGQKVRLASFAGRVNELLDESDFRSAWGTWLSPAGDAAD
jgi:hypothetical protein